MKSILALVVALSLPTSAPAAPPIRDPIQFIKTLYSNRAMSTPGRYPLWWSYLTGPALASHAHVLRVERETGDSLIDEDFLCQCQDTQGLHLDRLIVSQQTPTRFAARIRFSYGSGNSAATSLRIELANDGTGWKIVEMANAQGQTFTAENIEALKRYPGK